MAESIGCCSPHLCLNGSLCLPGPTEDRWLSLAQPAASERLLNNQDVLNVSMLCVKAMLLAEGIHDAALLKNKLLLATFRGSMYAVTFAHGSS